MGRRRGGGKEGKLWTGFNLGVFLCGVDASTMWLLSSTESLEGARGILLCPFPSMAELTVYTGCSMFSWTIVVQAKKDQDRKILFAGWSIWGTPTPVY